MGAARDVAKLVKVCWSLLLGNTVEWYEFAVYGYLEPYLQEHFFRGSAVATWLGFAVTFLARPLGGVVLGMVGDTCGRKYAVNLSIIGMVVGTCGQGLLPCYANGNTWGSVGLCLLVVLRIIQGLCTGGEISTISTYLTEVGEKRSLGRSVTLIQLTATTGFLAAKLVVFAVTVSVGSDAMKKWGWRLPFIFALCPALLAIWGRRHMPESSEFLAQTVQQKAKGAAEAAVEEPSVSTADTVAPAAPACQGFALNGHWPAILVGMLAVAGVGTTQYGGCIFTQAYLAKHGVRPADTMLAELVGRFVAIAWAPIIGWLTDVQGVGWVTFYGGCALTLGGLPAFAAIAAHPTSMAVVLTAYSLVITSLYAFVGSTVFMFVAELFPTSVRSTAVGISYNIGLSIFGGLAPLAAALALDLSPVGPGFLLSAGGVLTAFSVLLGFCFQRAGLVHLTHVRHTPYYRACLRCGSSSRELGAARHDEKVGKVEEGTAKIAPPSPVQDGATEAATAVDAAV